jgi:predicted nuclease of restriction endonuclease-like (RecB) superfamily
MNKNKLREEIGEQELESEQGNTAIQIILSAEYQQWFKEIKTRIASARIHAALSANAELIQLYWYLGGEITRKQKLTKWGIGFIDQFSLDLKKEFPESTGFSSKNLRYCRAFYRFYSDLRNWQQPVANLLETCLDGKWQQLVAKIKGDTPDAELLGEFIGQHCGRVPWGHNIHIFTKTNSLGESLFYIRQTIENGWGRDVLALQIKSKLYERAGNAVTNFTRTLPAPQSDLAQQTLKDPYTFDFMTMTTPYNERDIERQLIRHIAKFLLELGRGFAFIGQQQHLEVGGTDYYMDLLFYHVVLKCYVVVELKNTKFIPEYAGKLNFYLSAVDSMMKHNDDNPTIGLLLCRDKNNIEVEFALRDINKPIGVSEYTLTEILPENLKGSLPTVEEIEADLQLLEKTNKQNTKKRKHI